MNIIDGKIMVFSENETNSYVIEQITADYKEDIANVIGVVRCTAITIKSNAPLVHNSRAQIELYNIFADIEYNDANNDGSYVKNAKKAISKRTGVDISRIEIERS